MQQSHSTQIILLTGYLGAGKTTLIKYILKNQTKYKVAVIQNEFADEMGIESPLMQDSEGKQFDIFYELPNGCICCTAKGELLLAVQYFIENQKLLDFILVETNGLADPSSTIQTFWIDKELNIPAELSAVEAIIPAHRFKELWETELFMKQLIYADLILINHIDKVQDKQQIEVIKNSLLSTNPTCKILEASYCQYPLDELFSISAYKPQLKNIAQPLKSLHTDVGHAFIEHNITHTHNQWERNIGTILWEKDFKILRMKGLLEVENSEYIYQLQGVNETFEIVQTDVKWDSNQRLSKILFIGQKIGKTEIVNILQEKN